MKRQTIRSRNPPIVQVLTAKKKVWNNQQGNPNKVEREHHRALTQSYTQDSGKRQNNWIKKIPPTVFRYSQQRTHESKNIAHVIPAQEETNKSFAVREETM